ncbi:MAG: methylmalonyl Co-A mutase-associated GTPase MeaB [Acidobacteria bacterium]|nr:methylmalonyl Co-A mutase-associated GTPase MeaB [Acidobacteriota bacterium]
MTQAELVEGVRAAAPRALARALSIVERGGAEARDLLKAVRPGGAPPHVVGLTGPPGAGKSSLADELGLELARREGPLAVLAVDPSSPFSGGAILGDRLRMSRLASAPGCFVRSMATRGALGGLTAASADAVDLFAAAGFGRVMVETVGVGQDEVDVMHLADTVVLTLPPGLGDEVQAAKAGIMEIGHIFAVTKADLPGADEVEAHVRGMLELQPAGGWSPPVVQVAALEGRGIGRLADLVVEHRSYLAGDGRREGARRERAERRLRSAVEDLAWRTLTRNHAELVREAVDRIAAGDEDLYSAAESLLGRVAGEPR